VSTTGYPPGDPNVFVITDSADPDLTAPTNPAGLPAGTPPTVVWPLPRSPKNDAAVVIRNALDLLGLPKEKIPIITSGGFHASMMRDDEFAQRPVIVIVRSADAAERIAVGEIDQVFTATDIESGAILDINDVLKDVDTETVLLKDQVSNEMMEIWLFDENDQRLEQLYLLIKTVMFAGTKTFMEQLGYLDVLRVNGSDSATLQTASSGGVYVVFERSMQYRMRHLDFLAGVGQVAQLIQETFTVTSPVDGTETPASESAFIGDGGQ
jgi:hypothetical protein